MLSCTLKTRAFVLAEDANHDLHWKYFVMSTFVHLNRRILERMRDLIAEAVHAEVNMIGKARLEIVALSLLILSGFTPGNNNGTLQVILCQCCAAASCCIAPHLRYEQLVFIVATRFSVHAGRCTGELAAYVRLVGVNASEGQGELQYYDGSAWADVCSGAVGIIEAQMACQDLGFSFLSSIATVNE